MVDLALGILTDLHLARPGTPPSRFNNLVERGRSWELLDAALAVLPTDLDALILLGDIADRPDAALYTELSERLNRLRVPVYAIAGNHDLAADGTDAVLLESGAVHTHPDAGPAGEPGRPDRHGCGRAQRDSGRLVAQ